MIKRIERGTKMDSGCNGKGAKIELRRIETPFGLIWNVKAAKGVGNGTAGRFILDNVPHTAAYGFAVTPGTLDKFVAMCSARDIKLVFVEE